MIIYTDIGSINTDETDDKAAIFMAKKYEYYSTYVFANIRLDPESAYLQPREGWFTSQMAFYKTLDKWNQQFLPLYMAGKAGWIYTSK